MVLPSTELRGVFHQMIRPRLYPQPLIVGNCGKNYNTMPQRSGRNMVGMGRFLVLPYSQAAPGALVLSSDCVGLIFLRRRQPGIDKWESLGWPQAVSLS